MIRTPLFAAIALLGIAVPALAQVSPRAKAAHERAIVLDTHFDTPALLSRPGWDITQRHEVSRDGSQVDLPRMIEGGVDGGFFAVFTPQGPRTKAGDDAARAAALVRAVEIREMLVRHGDKFELALTAADAARIAASGKRIVYMSIENAQPLAGDVGMLAAFHGLGVRLCGFAHSRNNAFADSATDTAEWQGLSPAGIALLAEMNRLGVVPDPSHSSNAAQAQIIELSKAPVIMSHSGVAAVFDHPRNVPDDILRKLAAKGGVIQINAFSSYMIPPAPANPERARAMSEVQARYAGRRLNQADVERRTAEQAAVSARYPATPRATIDDLVKHVVHVIKLVGVDHVGISGDFDGGGGVEGFDSVADFPKLTEKLMAAGVSEADVAKIWGGNVLRVMAETEAYVAGQRAR